ncbi:MAG: DUF4013 domain-containing protein [Eggerthellaceae bacterium]|jgi:hypothetical protein
MKQGYFLTAWRDIRQSKGWLRNLLLLSLINLIPVFGQIVVLGYLYGWARDIAWGIRTPMPAHIQARKGDHMLLRGLHLFVLEVIFMAVPVLFAYLTAKLMTTFSVNWLYLIKPYFSIDIDFYIATAAYSLCYVLAVIIVPCILVGWMRISIYGRLSAGFQIARIWRMIRYRMSGLLRIAGILLLLVAAIVLFALVLALAVGLLGLAYSFGVSIFGGQVDWAGLGASLMPMAIAFIPLVAYALSVLTVFAHMVISRAMGYWTAQFDVPHWQGQDDPMPFEKHGVEKPVAPHETS